MCALLCCVIRNACMWWKMHSGKRDRASAGLLVQPVGDRENGTVGRGFLEGGQNQLFRRRVQICRDLIEQQDLRLCGDRACDRQKLPLSLGKERGIAYGVVAAGEFLDRIIQPDRAGCADHLLSGDGAVKQGDLVGNGSGNHAEALFDIAEDMAL